MKIFSFTLLFFTFALSCLAQKDITLEEIWDGAFRAEYLDEIQPMKDSNFYSVFTFDRQTRETKIEQRSYTDKNHNEVILSSTEIPIPYFETYEFSEDENLILLGAQIESRYRYTKSALYFIYNRTTKKLIQIFDKPIFNPTLSPNNKQIAFVFENNIYVKDITAEKITQITKDGQKNSIINGLSDWVYEEEFELISSFDWNADGSKIAYLKFDESNVKEYNMEVYKNENYPDLETFKYPKAGEENSTVSLHVYDLKKANTSNIDLSKYESYYTPYLNWSKNANTLVVKCLNRHQNILQLVEVNTNNNSSVLLYEEKNNSYVEYNNHLTFLDNEAVSYTHLTLPTTPYV